MKLLEIFKTKEIISKLGFTLLIVLLFRAVAIIPIPSIPADALRELLQGSSFFQVLSLLSGGLLNNIGILIIGLGPYINASYVFQLLSVVFPQVRELYQGGPIERRKLTLYTRLLSVPLAIIQSVVIYSLLSRFGLLSETVDSLQIASIIALLTFGSMFTMWLGELISEFGVGGGSSVIILVGILATLPSELQTTFLSMTEISKQAWLIVILLVLVIVAVILALSYRKIKLIYARRVRPDGMPGYINYIPISINPAGVMPVIFAVTVLDLPRLISSYLSQNVSQESIKTIADAIVNLYNNRIGFDVVLAIITIAFAFLSAFIIFRPKEIAENVNKQGAYIEGVRPGKETEKYIQRALLYTTFYGAFFLAVLTLLPNLSVTLLGLSSLAVTGTGILIVASVILDVIRQIQAIISTKHESRDYY